MKPFKFISVFLVLLGFELQSQSFLRITYTHFGSTKVYEVINSEVLHYKLKGEHSFRKDKIISMKDSTIMFENYTEIKLNQIKALRLNKNIHLLGTFQVLFMAGGVGFITLNTINNLITDVSPVFSPKAAYISAALLATGFLIREMGIKRIRMTKNKDLKILNIDFQHMNADSTSAVK